MKFNVRSDGVMERFADSVGKLPQWMPAIVRRNLDALAPSAEDRMREAIAANRYTGALEESITHSFEDGGYELHVYPAAKRGSWDGGTLLEMGTRPHTPPWAPIKAWAEFRGLPPFPIWYGIRTKGTAAHPFLERTKTALMPQIMETARRIVEQGAQAVVSGLGTESVR